MLNQSNLRFHEDVTHKNSFIGFISLCLNVNYVCRLKMYGRAVIGRCYSIIRFNLLLVSGEGSTICK